MKIDLHLLLFFVALVTSLTSNFLEFDMCIGFEIAIFLSFRLMALEPGRRGDILFVTSLFAKTTVRIARYLFKRKRAATRGAARHKMLSPRPIIYRRPK